MECMLYFLIYTDNNIQFSLLGHKNELSWVLEETDEELFDVVHQLRGRVCSNSCNFVTYLSDKENLKAGPRYSYEK